MEMTILSRNLYHRLEDPRPNNGFRHKIRKTNCSPQRVSGYGRS